jgi:predicted HNH restriction endonuclease
MNYSDIRPMGLIQEIMYKNAQLGKALHRATPITVKKHTSIDFVTVQQRTDEGAVEYCNHDGAEREIFTDYIGYGEYMQEVTTEGFACDKCELVNVNGEWI